MSNNFREWLRIRTDEGFWDDLSNKPWSTLAKVVPSQRLKNRAAVADQGIQYARQHREELFDPARKEFMRNPTRANMEKIPGLLAAEEEFVDKLGLSHYPEYKDAWKAAHNIADARVVGIPLQITRKDVQTILNALWMPQNGKPPLTIQNPKLASLDSPEAIITYYNGLKTTPQYNPSLHGEEGWGHWTLADDIESWNREVLSTPGRYRGWLAKHNKDYETMMAKSDAEIAAHKASARAGRMPRSEKPEKLSGKITIPIDAAAKILSSPPTIDGMLSSKGYTPEQIDQIKDSMRQIAIAIKSTKRGHQVVIDKPSADVYKVLKFLANV